MTTRVIPSRTPLSRMWLPRWLTTTKPAPRRAFSSLRADSAGSFAIVRLERCQDGPALGNMRVRVLQVEAHGFLEVLQRRGRRPPLACHVKLRAPGDEPASLLTDDGGKLHAPAHVGQRIK